MLQCRGQGCSGVFLGDKTPVAAMAGGEGLSVEPWAPPQCCPAAPGSPLAQDDLELGVVQAGD